MSKKQIVKCINTKRKYSTRLIFNHHEEIVVAATAMPKHRSLALLIMHVLSSDFVCCMVSDFLLMPCMVRHLENIAHESLKSIEESDKENSLEEKENETQDLRNMNLVFDIELVQYLYANAETGISSSAVDSLSEVFVTRFLNL
ncbi:hypothetical protein VNO77_04148 [Canavalia gladiata]|uniref:Uncharacterized protein n=1 Tax=Canavalia gladiata TaxID=3824 RepID=A0AAN9N2I4_CANGL